MTSAEAETAVTTAALIAGGIYVYRKTTEAVTKAPTSKQPHTPRSTAEGVIGVGELLPTGTWLTGMGVTFIGLSIITSINPNLGGSLAILVATGTFLGNGMAVIADVQGGLAGHASPAGHPGQKIVGTKVVANKAGGPVEVPILEPIH